MKQKLHIVSLENPYPANYGGVIGIFNRIKALHEAGLEIYLHVFYYDREPMRELELYCHKVYYYKRDMRKTLMFSSYPFIVVSRASKKLLDQLVKTEAPILFEGLHVCFYLNHPALKDRIRLVRMHNVEHDYYYHLSQAEKNPIKKWYLKRESEKLKKFEPILQHCTRILSVSEADQGYFSEKYSNAELMPVFIDETKFVYRAEQNPAIIYHGNLSVSENELAAVWLIENVFSKITYSCIIAGKNPSQKLIQKIKKYKHIELLANPSEILLNEKIQTSAVCVLPTFQATGIKLKLLDSFMQGKHVIVNATMLSGTGLTDFCKVAETPEQFIHEIEQNIQSVFSLEEFESRKKYMLNYFNNQRSVQRIIELIKGAED